MKLGVLTTGHAVAVDGDDVYALAAGDLRYALANPPSLGKRLGQVADVSFAAPYVSAAKIVCHVVNYRAHATGVGPPSRPYFFTKPSGAVVDPGAAIQPHTHMSKELDWETELALVFARGMTFLPGDIIATGTPEGTAMDSEATPYLQPGDIVRCEIENIGVLENPIGS